MKTYISTPPDNVKVSRVLQADVPQATDAPLAITDLTLNLVAGHWYQITGVIYADLSANVPSAFTIDGGAATATGIVGEYSGFIDGSMFAEPIEIFGSSWTWNSLSGFSGTTMQFVLTIQVNAGGTFVPQIVLAADDASPTTILKYSTIQAVDITPSA